MHLPAALAACLCFFAPALLAAAPARSDESILLAIATGSRAEVDRAIEDLRYRGRSQAMMRRVAGMLLEGEPAIRENAAYVFSVLADPRDARLLASALEDENPIVRLHACTGLGRMKASKAVGGLIARTQDRASPVRREAVRALARIGSREAVPAALALLKDLSPEPREAAIVALGELHDPRALAGLRPLMKEGPEHQRLLAVRSLCMLGDEEARAVARRLLASEQPLERRDGVRVIEAVRAGWARQALVARLTDPDFDVRLAAALALARGGDGRGVQALVLAADKASGSERAGLESAIEDLRIEPTDRQRILLQARGTK